MFITLEIHTSRLDNSSYCHTAENNIHWYCFSMGELCKQPLRGKKSVFMKIKKTRIYRNENLLSSFFLSKRNYIFFFELCNELFFSSVSRIVETCRRSVTNERKEKEMCKNRRIPILGS